MTTRKNTQTSRKFDRAAMQYGVKPEVIMTAPLDTMFGTDKSHVTRNQGYVGFIALALCLGYNHPAIREAQQAISGSDEGQRASNAVQYMDRVGNFLSAVGKATGILFNCAAASAVPAQLDETQRSIFGDQQRKTLISVDALVNYANAAAATQIEIDEHGTTKSAAELWIDHLASTAGIDNHVWAAIFMLAIQGALNADTFVSTVQALRKENATLDHVAPAARQAAKRHFAQTPAAYQA